MHASAFDYPMRQSVYHNEIYAEVSGIDQWTEAEMIKWYEKSSCKGQSDVSVSI